ncbi:MAG: hypothetical protein KME31_35290 [Tolypothrix carrinoi HA7290-LM1]|jgi:hypothetical protein|nr:hypothetical protein [Tolypothrix carrinoi HA7290-LM1]
MNRGKVSVILDIFTNFKQLCPFPLSRQVLQRGEPQRQMPQRREPPHGTGSATHCLPFPLSPLFKIPIPHYPLPITHYPFPIP